MKKRLLGKTGVTVAELGLGTAFMAAQGQAGVDECVARAMERGVNYIDTAANYGKGKDEEMLGTALRGRRGGVFLATKVGCVADPGGHRKVDSLMAQFEGSLRRLQTDRVDLIQLHEADQRKWWTDDAVAEVEAVSHTGPLIKDDEEYDLASAPCVEFLHRAKAQGKARFIGITGKDARRLARLVEAGPYDSMMVAHQHNPIYRNAGHFLLSLTEQRGLGVAGGAMFIKGWLAVAQEAWRRQRPAWMDDTFFRAYFGYLDLQAQSGIPLPELTLRWLLGEPRIHCIATGFSAWDEIAANIAALEKGPLPADLQAAIDAVGIVHPLRYQGRQTL
ncbi:MAG: hypothetical protein CME20_11935 [Gemmatimonadetes bacterium]|nr:hypothetical protein [Gemmatimonadota bacterium]